MIKICVAGATGWTGSAVTKAVLAASDLSLVAAIARKSAGRDIGEALGQVKAGVTIVSSLAEALEQKPDVLVDYTGADSVKARVLAALERRVRVVIGASGLSAITRYSRACSSIPNWIAWSNSSGRTLSHGGTPP